MLGLSAQRVRRTVPTMILAVVMVACGSTASPLEEGGTPLPSSATTPTAGVRDHFGVVVAEWPSKNAGQMALLDGMPASIGRSHATKVASRKAADGRSYWLRYGGTNADPGMLVVIHPPVGTMSPVMSLWAYVGWINGCRHPDGSGSADEMGKALTAYVDPHSTGADMRPLLRAMRQDQDKHPWFACAYTDIVGERHPAGPRVMVAWATPDAVYWVSARTPADRMRLVRALEEAAR